MFHQEDPYATRKYSQRTKTKSKRLVLAMDDPMHADYVERVVGPNVGADPKQRTPSPRSVTVTVEGNDEHDSNQLVPADVNNTNPYYDGDGQTQVVPRSSVKQIVPVVSPYRKANAHDGFGLKFNRETLLVAGIGIVISLLVIAGGAASFLALLALATAPVWLPIVILTTPLWLPIAFLTSPLWISGAAVVACCAACALFFAVVSFATFVFFAYPAHWLPQDSDTCKWLLYHRDRATIALVKIQAKIVLYAAGVGPMADAIFVVVDRIDLADLQRALKDFDLKEWTDNVRQMDVAQMQAAIIAAVRSMVGF